MHSVEDCQDMEEDASKNRFWVSVHYRCCNTYQRVYFRKGTRTTSGRCPLCMLEVSFRIAEDAESGRFFTAEQE